MIFGKLAYRGSLSLKSVVTINGNLPLSVSTPPSTSLVTLTSPSSPSRNSIFDACVACPHPSNPASICPVWLLSSSILCLPNITILLPSASATFFSNLATPNGSSSPCVSEGSICTWMLRSAPMAMAVRSTSVHFAGPIESAMMSETVGVPRSRRRTAASMPISSKGFMECLTPEVSIAVWALLTRGFTWMEG